MAEEFQIRWRANEVLPRYLTSPNPERDPVFQFNITDDKIPENVTEYLDIVLTSQRNGVFYPNAVGRVTIVDDDICMLLLMYMHYLANKYRIHKYSPPPFFVNQIGYKCS